MAIHITQLKMRKLRAIFLDTAPPEWVSAASLGTFNSGGSVSLSLYAVKSSGDPVKIYRVATGSSLPSGFLLDTTTGLLTGTLPTVSSGITQTLSFTVEAVSGGFSTARTFTIKVTLAPPVWVTESGMIFDGVAGNEVVVQLTASDPDKNITSYSIVSGSLPSGISLNTNSGTVSGILPTLSTTTTYVFTVRVTDSFGNANDRSFSIRVKVYGTEVVWVTDQGTLADASIGAALRASLTAVSRQILI